MIVEIMIYMTLVLCLVASVLCYKKSRNTETYQDELYSAISIMTVLFSIALFSGILFGAFHDNNYKSEFSIVSLEMQNELYGSFFLGTGTIEDVNYYYVYKKTSIGLVFEKILVKDLGRVVYIVETNDISPRYVVETVCKEEPSMLNWFQDCKSVRKLIVPKGTIIREFRL